MPILIITGVSFVLSLAIVFVDLKYNKVDAYIEEVEKLLPGYNCGMCGYAGCKGMALAMVDDPNSYLKCRPLKEPGKAEIIAYLKLKKKI